MKNQTEIQAASVARGKDKITHEVYYVVKSDEQKNIWHEVRWNNERLSWQCDGDKCKFQAGGTTCKHARAVNEVLKIRRATIALAMGGQTPKIVARLQAEEDVRGHLNGSSSGFSLLK